MPGDERVRLLIGEEVDFSVIAGSLNITDEKVNEVNELIKKELAERARVAALLEKVADKSTEEKVRHLYGTDVSEALIIEMAGVGQGDIDVVKKALEEELKEKQRLAEEEAARKPETAVIEESFRVLHLKLCLQTAMTTMSEISPTTMSVPLVFSRHPPISFYPPWGFCRFSSE